MKYTTLQTLLLCSIVLFAYGCTPEKKTPAKPNIIYILADDAGYGDLSCYGQTKFSTPNIDALAAAGLKFTDHYSGSTVCAPSRSALLTGLHTGHTPIRGNREVAPEGQQPMTDTIPTLAKIFKQAGYATGAFGKWGLGYPGSEGDPLNQGFDRFFGFNCQRFGHNYYPTHLWDNTDSLVIEGNLEGKTGVFAPSLIHEKALSFLEENKDKPFFMYVPTIIPHAELVAPEPYMEKYRGKYGEEKPYKGYDEGKKFRKGPYQSQAEPHAAFAAMMHLLDDHVGAIVQKVKELGLEENTLIVFASDNGPHLEGGADPNFFDGNGPLKGFKRDLYEGGIRVPMIAYWPGVVKQGVTDHVSAFWDVLPTFTELINQQVPDVDGVSFLPTLLGQNEKQQQHEYLYWEFHERGGRQAVRKGNYKAVRYNVYKDPDSTPELYDLTKDIGEDNNIADAHPELVAEMAQIMKEARTPSPVFSFGKR